MLDLASCRGLEFGGLRFTAWQGSHERRARLPARARAGRCSKEPAAAAEARSPLRLVFVGTEVAPWSKIGGLGDIMRALPTALAKRGHSVITVTPRYGDHPDIRPTGVRVPLQPGGRRGTRRAGARPQTAELYTTAQDGVTHVFVEHPLFLKGSMYAPLEEASVGAPLSHGGASMTYMPSSALDPVDQRVRVLCAAALGVPEALFGGLGNRACEQPVVFVCNDWPAALVPLLLRAGRSEAEAGRSGFETEAGRSGAESEAGRSGAESEAGRPGFKTEAGRSGFKTGAGRSGFKTGAGQPGFKTEAVQPGSKPSASPSLFLNLARRLRESVQRSRLGPAPLSVLCLHNAAFQGRARLEPGSLRRLGLPRRLTALVAEEPPAAGEPRALNLLRGALACADGVVTVSPSYAAELVGGGGGGGGLGELAARSGLRGILNGLDTREWDPRADPHLPPRGRFDPACERSTRRGKAFMKQAVQRECGLDLEPGVPLFVFVGRLASQKGVDILIRALALVFAPGGEGRLSLKREGEAAMPSDPVLASLTSTNPHALASPRVLASATLAGTPPPPSPSSPTPFQVVLLGSGDPALEAALSGLGALFPGRAAGLPRFSEPAAHRLLAAADAALVPSRFEPCGLVALAALRYRAGLVASEAGGLRDILRRWGGLAVPRPGSGDGEGGSDARQDAARLAESLLRAAHEVGRLGKSRDGMLAAGAGAEAADLGWEEPAARWESMLYDFVDGRGRKEAAPSPR